MSETSRNGALLLDVRTPGEFREAHIPDSLNIPLADLPGLAGELGERLGDRELVVICRTGQRAERACARLREAGVEGATVLAGGLERWAEEGSPVTRGRKAMSIERQVRVTAGALVAAGTALGVFVSPWFLILPGFVGCGLVFAGLTDTCGMAMMLAKLPFNRARKVDLASCGL